MSDWEELRQIILDKGLKFNKGIDSNGNALNLYIDCCEVLLDSKGAYLASKLIYEQLKEFKSQYIGGNTLAVSLLVSSLVLAGPQDKPVKGFMIRPQKKKLGLQKQIEGQFKAGESVVIIDDTFAENSAVFQAIKIVENHGGKVEGVVGLIDCGGVEKLKKNVQKVELIYTQEDLNIGQHNDNGTLFEENKKVDAIIFDITYRCNDNCVFCCVKDKLDRGKTDPNKGEMSLEEIKKTTNYILDEYNPDTIIISGGEPTIHTDFWKTMDFFLFELKDDKNIVLDTNAIMFSEQMQAQKLYSVLSRCKKNKSVEVSLSSVNHNGNLSRYEKTKLNGVLNTIKVCLETNTQIILSMFVTKNNYKNLPFLARKVRDIIIKYDSSLFKIELGLLSLGISEEQKKLSIPNSIEETLPHIRDSIRVFMKVKDIKFMFTNLPLCLFKDEIEINELLDRIQKISEDYNLCLVNVWQKQGKISGIKWSKHSSKKLSHIMDRFCDNCVVSERCNKLNRRYYKTEIAKKISPYC